MRWLKLCAVVSLLSSAAVLATASGTVWLLFVDDLHLDFRNTGRLRDGLRAVITDLVRDDDRVIIRSSGPSLLAVDATSDRQLLAAAIKRTAGNALKPGDVLNSQPGPHYEPQYRLEVALSAARQMIASVESMFDTRKALIYVSNGYFGVPGTQSALDELSGMAARAGIRIFAIDARSIGAASLNDPILDDAAWQRYVETTRDSLRMLAEPTGGFAPADGETLRETLRRINLAMRN